MGAGHYRTVPLPDDVVTQLRVWKAKAGNTPYVFLDLKRLAAISSRIERGTWRHNEPPISSPHGPFRTMQKRARELVARRRGVVVDEINWRLGTPHDRRDTYIMRLANNGVPLHVASRIAGHSDIKITEKFYLQASHEDDDRILAALATGNHGAVQGTNREQMASGAA